MIVSDKYKFVYFHIPKTAGSTVSRSLKDYNSRDRFINNKVIYNRDAHQAHYIQHATYSQFSKMVEASLLEDYFSFTFVRNPYCKFYSAYQQHSTKAYPRILRDSSFNEYVQHNINGYCVERVWIYSEFLPCHLFTHVNGVPVIDFIGYGERFIEDFRKVCSVLNLSGVDVLNANVFTEPKLACDPLDMKIADYKYIDKYDRQSIQLVNEIYHLDFEYFDYKMLDPKDFPEQLELDN